MIRVFVGSSAKYAAVEPVMEYSIRKHASVPVEITFMRPENIGMQPTGCTGFTNTRYAIPELCNYEGFAIYLDVDMVLFADIAELYEYRREGRWCCLRDGSNEVMVLDCGAFKPPSIATLHQHHKSQLRPPYKAIIPLEWNCEDEVKTGMKLLHFTDLSRQPWFTPERNDTATQKLKEIQDDQPRHHQQSGEVSEGLDRRTTRNPLRFRFKGFTDKDTAEMDT